MPAIGNAVRLLAFTLGACLEIFLVAAVIRRRAGTPGMNFVPVALALAALGHAAGAITLFRRLSVATAGEASGAPTVVLVPAAALLAAAALASVYAALWRAEASMRRFLLVLALSLAAIPIAGALVGSDSAALALASVAPSAVFAWFVYRYNLLGLHISRRVVFALVLGGFFAFYLFLVRLVATLLENAYASVGPLTEAALIFAATLVWLPLYGWMTRFLSERTQLYAGFSKRLIEDAARILDLEKRLQFLAEELGRTFALGRVRLQASGEPPVCGEFGGSGTSPAAGLIIEIEKIVQREALEVVRADPRGGGSAGRLVRDLGFNYLFPLWYERKLVGLLFLDTTPRLYLDESQDILLGLSRQISHSIETCRVIEEKIGLERALARQAHLASLGKAAATIAHEVRNPLSSIKALAQFMREDPEVREKHERDLGFMISETDRLNSSVEQLLSFSRPLPAPRQEVHLSEMLEDIARALSRQCAAEQIRVELEVEPGLMLRQGAPELIRQIVLNLALNAIQASQPGGKVVLGAGARSERTLGISVSDDGCGIAPEIRDRIFEPFFTTRQRGTGLGLAIVQKNVEHLGGTIRAESPLTNGRGTRIDVTLPIG
jgi:signal transduction histidine kinase